METTDFVRDPIRVNRALAKVSNKLVAKEPVRIYIPVRYAEKNLAYIGGETYTLGIFMIATEDKRYAISLITAMVPIDPTNTLTVDFNGVKYYEFYFRKGANVINNLNLVKDKKLIYSIFNEIISSGKAPWYLGYNDFANILSSAGKHAGVNIGENHEAMELLTSHLARDPNDRSKQFRLVVNSYEDVKNIRPAMIPLRSIQYSVTDTVTKLAGSYFRPAVVSALVSPTEREERVSTILRK